MTDETVLPPSLEPEILPKSTPGTERGWAGVTALVLGLINLFAWCLPICGAPLSIAGIIIGFIGLKTPNRGVSIAGIVLNVIGLILSVIATAGFISLWASGWFQNFDPNQFYFQ